MTNKQIGDKLSLVIIRSSMKAKYAIMQIAEDNHITLMQALTLCLLDANQTVSMKSLSTFMACDPSNVTNIVEQLVVEGLIDRKEAAFDRRVKTLTLTKSGLKLRNKFLDVTANTRLPYLDSLSDSETNQLITILEKASDASLV